MNSATVGDNQGVVSMVKTPPSMAQLAKFQLAGVWRNAMVQTGWRQVSGRAEHIRSHQLDHDPQLILSTDLSPTDRHKLLGNQLADEMATSAQEHHDEYH